jgi:hypothetical protein
MGIYECGFERPSPVQEEVIPYALAGTQIKLRMLRPKYNCAGQKWNRKNRIIHYSYPGENRYNKRIYSSLDTSANKRTGIANFSRS